MCVCVLPQMLLEQLDIHMVKNESWLLPRAHTGSKWIIVLNIETKSIKWIEENIGENFRKQERVIR